MNDREKMTSRSNVSIRGEKDIGERRGWVQWAENEKRTSKREIRASIGRNSGDEDSRSLGCIIILRD
jgi:hypothetical protein